MLCNASWIMARSTILLPECVRHVPWVENLCNAMAHQKQACDGYLLEDVLCTLLSSKGKQWHGILGQIIVQCGKLLDKRVNAMEGSTDAVQAMVASGAVDQDAMDSLAMGEGVEGRSSYLPDQLVANTKALGIASFFYSTPVAGHCTQILDGRQTRSVSD